MTADKIIRVLMDYHKKYSCLVFRELRRGVGYSYDRTIDLFTFETWPSRGFNRIAYEVKISRSDFVREIRDPSKRAGFRKFANEFYFATPPGLLSPGEIPSDTGLIEISETGRRKIIISSPHIENPPDWGFLASLARRLVQQEDKGINL